MRDIVLVEGDLGLVGGDLVVREDRRDYLLKSLTTPQGYLSQIAYMDGRLVEVDTDYGNAIYAMLSEDLTPQLIADMREATSQASRGAAKSISLTFADPTTVDIAMDTDEGRLEFSIAT